MPKPLASAGHVCKSEVLISLHEWYPGQVVMQVRKPTRYAKLNRQV